MNRLTFLIWISVVVTMGQGIVCAQQPPAFSSPGIPPSAPVGLPSCSFRPSAIPADRFPPPQFAPVPTVPGSVSSGQSEFPPPGNRFFLPNNLSEKLRFFLRERVLHSNCQAFPVSRKRRRGLSNSAKRTPIFCSI